MGALGDGIIDAAITMVYERRFRPEDKVVQTWLDRQQVKIDGALAALEKAPPAWGANPDYGHLTVAAALGYLDFRHEGKWRAKHPEDGRLARQIRGRRAGVREDQAAGLNHRRRIHAQQGRPTSRRALARRPARTGGRSTRTCRPIWRRPRSMTPMPSRRRSRRCGASATALWRA